jgi:hypothetical protein
MEIWLETAKSFGVPVCFLAAILYALWQVCRWLAPRLDKLIDAHMAFLDATGKAIAAQTPKVEDIHGMVSDLHSQATHAA